MPPLLIADSLGVLPIHAAIANRYAQLVSIPRLMSDCVNEMQAAKKGTVLHYVASVPNTLIAVTDWVCNQSDAQFMIISQSAHHIDLSLSIPADTPLFHQ